MAQYKRVTATEQTTKGTSKLIGIVVCSTTSGTIAIYDSATASTSDPKIIETLTPSAGTTYYFGPEGIDASKGLYIVIANTLVVTLIYKGNPM